MIKEPTLVSIEAKYTFTVGAAEFLKAGLKASSFEDSEYPSNEISSVYFDSPARFHLAEKVNSDYLKTKVRLRWYGSLENCEPTELVQAFMEVKSKQGVVRKKDRIPVEFPATALLPGQERFDELEKLACLALDCGYSPRGPIFPMIVIRYSRSRFTEPATFSRVSLDTDIRYTGVNERFFPRTEPRRLSNGVLEIKSRDGALPPSFLLARSYLNKRDSFSKYEECWQLHRDPTYRRQFQWMQFGR